MNRNIVKVTIIAILTLWCLLDWYSVPQINDLFELVVGFFVLTLIPLIALFLTSFSLSKNSSGWQKVSANVGIAVSVITLVVNILMYIWDFVR